MKGGNEGFGGSRDPTLYQKFPKRDGRITGEVLKRCITDLATKILQVVSYGKWINFN